jgi:hypothetical protein
MSCHKLANVWTIGNTKFLVGLVSLALGFVSASQARAHATYTLKPTPKTVAWGYCDAKAAPVLCLS